MAVKADAPAHFVFDIRLGDIELKECVDMDDMEFVIDQIIARAKEWA